ncbi:unnamed protein product, partial [Ectocarpus fasciculatus]
LRQVVGPSRTKGEQRYVGATIPLILLQLTAVPNNVGRMSRQRNPFACNGNAHEQTIFTSRQSRSGCSLVLSNFYVELCGGVGSGVADDDTNNAQTPAFMTKLHV